MKNILFEEVMRFRGKWLWLLFVPPVLFLIFVVVLVFSVNKQDMSDGLIPLACGFFFSVFFTVMFYYVKLKTQITTEGIYVSFSFFNRKSRFIPLSEIEEIYVREFSPLGEYGGWGLRFRIGERAYIVSGKQGIQIKLKNGKKVLISTLKEEEAKSAISQLTNLLAANNLNH